LQKIYASTIEHLLQLHLQKIYASTIDHLLEVDGVVRRKKNPVNNKSRMGTQIPTTQMELQQMAGIQRAKKKMANGVNTLFWNRCWLPTSGERIYTVCC